VSARELYDTKRIREKHAREIERDLRAQGERTRLTSMPLDAPQTPAPEPSPEENRRDAK
jgi:hypothetical protein